MEAWELVKEHNEYKIDNKSRKDILTRIDILARSYTPEWKLDISNPDAASVIGLIFTNQTIDTIKGLNQSLKRYHIEFANMYGISLRAAIPSKTICAFKVSDKIKSGAALKKGTQVIGTNDNGDEIIFALCNDINATTAQLTDILAVSGTERKVINYKEKTDISLFSYKGENIHRQAVVMYFTSFPDISNNGIRLKFQGNLPGKTLSQIFSDRDKFCFSYLCEDGETPFDEVVNNSEYIEIRTDTAREDITAVILEMKTPVDENISLNKIEMFAAQWNDKPEFIWNGRNEITTDSFLPFTEQPVLYNELYIGQSFLFEQSGTMITLQFCLQFEMFSPQSAAIYEPDLRIIKRKPKKSFAQPRYECWVQEVRFDYFNGRGWKQLETDHDISTLFSNEKNSGEYKISFEVPSDWEPIVQEGYEGNCIRMQIVRADNCYMQGIEYHYPVISNFKICISEQPRGTQPSKVTSIQGTEARNVTEKIIGGEGFNAYTQLLYPGDYLFWGFDRNLGSGPAALFVELEGQRSFKDLELEFAYSGANGFKPLKVIDNTNSLQNSGIVMFIPPADMCECDVEGIRRYWIRLEDKNRYFAQNRDYVPVLKNIHMNAVCVENVIVNDEQDYYIDTVTANMKFPLYAENILSAQVWVNEKEQLSEEEIDRLVRDEDTGTRIEYNFLGEIEEFYVLWHEIDDFDNAADMERCYCIDRSKNKLLFGDGVHTRVPQNTNSIAFKARVLCCDGKAANIKEHTIDRFRGTVISVEDITNPIDAYGGTDLEDIKNALRRGSNILSSRNRLVSEADYVREALLFSDTIEQASCVTELTKISIVLLMKDYHNGDYSFKSIQNELKAHLLSRCEITCDASDIKIVEPVFVYISVNVWLSVPDISTSLEIKQSWTEKITRYLEPVQSLGGKGWRIGKLPGIKQIRLMLSALEGTAGIENINILASYTKDRHMYEMSLDRIEESPFMICCNGTHSIYINGM